MGNSFVQFGNAPFNLKPISLASKVSNLATANTFAKNTLIPELMKSEAGVLLDFEGVTTPSHVFYQSLLADVLKAAKDFDKKVFIIEARPVAKRQIEVIANLVAGRS